MHGKSQKHMEMIDKKSVSKNILTLVSPNYTGGCASQTIKFSKSAKNDENCTIKAL